MAAREPHWILKAVSVALLGAIPWFVFGFILNILIPLAGVAVCCQSLGPTYYLFAYWFPLAAAAIVGGLVLTVWYRDASSEKSARERRREVAKQAFTIAICWLVVMAWLGKLF